MPDDYDKEDAVIMKTVQTPFSPPEGEQHDNVDECTVQIPLDLQDGQEAPTRTDIHGVFELPKRKRDTFPVVVNYLDVEINRPYLDRHPDDPLHTVEKREIFVVFNTKHEADFVKRQEWTLHWKYGETKFKPIQPKHDFNTRAKLREIGQKVFAFERITKEMLDLGAISKLPVSGPNYDLVIGLPDCCLDAPDFEEQFQAYLKLFEDATTANDPDKQAQITGMINAFLRTRVKVNK